MKKILLLLIKERNILSCLEHRKPTLYYSRVALVSMAHLYRQGSASHMIASESNIKFQLKIFNILRLSVFSYRSIARPRLSQSDSTFATDKELKNIFRWKGDHVQFKDNPTPIYSAFGIVIQRILKRKVKIKTM